MKPNKVQSNHPLAKLTTFRVGGPAQYFLEARNLAELKTALSWARKEKLPIHLLGGGSNLLISDAGINGLTIRLSGKFAAITKSEIGAGAGLAALIKYCRGKNLGGMEFLAGIPGTVGGALAMNAGAFGSSLGNLVAWVKVIDKNGKVKKLLPAACQFHYRESIFQKSDLIILSVGINWPKSPFLSTKAQEYLQLRKLRQPWGASAGSVFKNPEGKFAGELIEKAGLKGLKIGDAEVSTQHANFILNRGKATAKDITQLIQLIQSRVAKSFHVKLDLEIRLL